MEYMYKPGDVVMVRDDLTGGRLYRMLSGETANDGIRATDLMETLRGQRVTIKSIENCGNTVKCYTINEHPRFWSDEMFVKIKGYMCKTLL